MTTPNQTPKSNTAALPQETQQDAEALINACKGQPAALKPSEVDEFDQWLVDTKVSRRVSLVMLSKPYDELESGVLNDRDFAVAVADAERCAAEVDRGLGLALDLVRQSRAWMLAALSGRPDCDEIIAKVDDNEENENAAQSHCSSVDDSDKNASEKGTYETVMAVHIKAIQPKFKALYDKYIFPGGSQLLTDPKSLGTETEALRNEIWELQNQMPVESEEGMDCRLAIDQLDFLIRLINAGLEFKESDLITLSLIVDRAGHDFSGSLKWLALDEGGDIDKDTLH